MPKLLAYGLVSKPCKVELLEVGDSEGATRQAITKKQIGDFNFYYPSSKKVQIGLIEKLDSISTQTQNLALIYEQQVTHYNVLKASILAQELQNESP
ncbi:MAG TPA: hypothetical protein EYN54_11025 [Methylococcaceae bacterium]|jgi:hypothetical protein|nr:hypothetical protein [Methylococcaceae bacterium]HIA45880.1 hypothetical protein [Methylococcaceae bacterium]HIN68239.1 hypothetical protein [Methylococcales bacterium]